MKHLIFAAFTLTIMVGCSPGKETSMSVLKKMHNTYSGKWYKTFTFNQTTEFYRHDSLVRSETWHEAVSFPGKFRIDFGNLDSGNAVIFKGDSVYSFRKAELVRSRQDENDLTFLLGGKYFMPFDQVTEKLKRLGYDLNKFHEGEWKERSAYVIGANSADEKVNQLWIDKEKLVLVRFVKFEDQRKEEGWFEDHVQLDGGWTETKVTFFINDTLAQKEIYHDWKANPPLDDRLFEPTKFGEWHWMKN